MFIHICVCTDYINNEVTYEVYTAVKIQDEILWDVIPCSVVVGYKLFGQPCSLHLQQQGPPKHYTTPQPRRPQLV